MSRRGPRLLVGQAPRLPGPIAGPCRYLFRHKAPPEGAEGRPPSPRDRTQDTVACIEDGIPIIPPERLFGAVPELSKGSAIVP